MNILIIFVEITSYNITRIKNVYEAQKEWNCDYVYCNESVSGHEYAEILPQKCTVLQGNKREKRKQLLSILNCKKYNFIEINGYSDGLRFMAVCYAKKHKIPYAIETDTQLNIPSGFIKRFIKNILLQYIFSGNSYGFAGGTRQTELFRAYGMDEDRIYVLPMTVDICDFLTIAERESKQFYKVKHGLGKKKVILYAGRFEKEKNLNVLLEAVSQLKDRHNDLILCLIGKGSLLNSLKNKCRKLGISGYAFFLEYMRMPELAEYYSLADVFVLPSEYEPWGLVVNEALACRTPVIVSEKVGAGDDLITPNINGDVFNHSNVKELSRLIEKWLYDAPKNMDFGIMERWNYNVYFERWINILSEVANGKQS